MKKENVLVTILVVFILGIGLGYWWSYHQINRFGIPIHIVHYESPGYTVTEVHFVRR